MPAANVVDIIANLLAGRADADDILVAAVDRLGFSFNDPSLAMAPTGPLFARLDADERAGFAAAFDFWRDWIAAPTPAATG